MRTRGLRRRSSVSKRSSWPAASYKGRIWVQFPPFPVAGSLGLLAICVDGNNRVLPPIWGGWVTSEDT